MIPIITIQGCVARAFGTSLMEMASARKPRRVARPRQVAMYLCRDLTRKSFPSIGRSFGGRDHSTVQHAVHRIKALMSADDGFREQVMAVRAEIEVVVDQARRRAIGEAEYTSWSQQ